MQSALYVNTLSIVYVNFQLHSSSHGFTQCGMQIYVMADIVTLDAPNATSHFYTTYHYIYLHYVCTYFVSTYTACIHKSKLQPYHQG